MKRLNTFVLISFLLLLFYSCQKEKSGISDLEKIRQNTNKKTYPAAQMDSAQAISSITKQKIQELLDLSTLYTSGNKDTEIDSVIYAQMKNYFAENETDQLSPLLKQLDSFKVKTAKVGNLNITKEVRLKDTLDFAQFDVEYYDNQDRLIGKYQKNAQYILKPSPVKFKKEFKFYFITFDSPVKDSTAVGVTK